MTFFRVIKVISIALLLLVFACSSDKKFDDTNLEEVYKYAMKLYNEKQYIEAAKVFEIIKLQFPSSKYSDDAQFYLAEIDFANEKFIYASFNYGLLRKYYPNSEFSKISLFKSALSLYMQSPKFDRDQEYSRKALNAMMEFQNMHPNDSLSKEANKYIQDLRNKLAEREYTTGTLYVKMEQFRSALIYFDIVINEYDDTKFYEEAYVGKIDMLLKLKKYDELLSIADVFLKLFPKSEKIEVIKAAINKARVGKLSVKK